MSTQNERDMFIELFPLAIDMATGNMKVAYMAAFDAFKAARAPLLSRIAELEEQLSIERASVAGITEIADNRSRVIIEQQSRIDALSKDAERYHKIKKFMHVDPDVGDDEYKSIPGLCIAYDRLCEAAYIEAWGEESEMIDAAIDTLPAIDAAISAREGE